MHDLIGVCFDIAYVLDKMFKVKAWINLHEHQRSFVTLIRKLY